MAHLATVLGMHLRERVLDETRLPGGWDLDISFAPVGGGPGPETRAAGDVSLPSLFTILEERLGLKLERRRAPVNVIVIEAIEPPAEN